MFVCCFLADIVAFLLCSLITCHFTPWLFSRLSQHSFHKRFIFTVSCKVLFIYLLPSNLAPLQSLCLASEIKLAAETQKIFLVLHEFTLRRALLLLGTKSPNFGHLWGFWIPVMWMKPFFLKKWEALETQGSRIIVLGCWLVLQEGNLAKPKSYSPLSHPIYNSRSKKSFPMVMSSSITARLTSILVLKEQQDLAQFPSFSSAFTEGQQREEGGSQSALPWWPNWSDVRTAHWRLESCTAGEERREIIWWATLKASMYPPISSPKLPALALFLRRCADITNSIAMVAAITGHETQ